MAALQWIAFAAMGLAGLFGAVAYLSSLEPRTSNSGSGERADASRS